MLLAVFHMMEQHQENVVYVWINFFVVEKPIKSKALAMQKGETENIVVASHVENRRRIIMRGSMIVVKAY